jgi:lipoprotein-anchoring transpeptidase ErfK/SrfK
LIVLCAVLLLIGVGVTVAGAARLRSSSDSSSRAIKFVDQKHAQRAELAKAVTVSPANGTQNVPPDARVFVGTNSGYLTSVTVIAPDGSHVAGVPAEGKWLSTGPLAPGSHYKVVVGVAGSNGVEAKTSTSFTTLTPAASIGAKLWPDSNLEVGVAQPIVVKFDQPIETSAAREAAIHHIQITTDPPVTLGAHWFNNKELHFRPANFWKSGTKVSVVANLANWNAGNGVWGAGQPTAHFTVGDARISTANLATHQMTVTENGKVVANFPMSGGREKYPTMNGTHIVLDRASVVHMISSSNGIPVNSPDGYDELVYSNVHISDSGEYVHGAPWSVGDQGVSNVSHGCINLSPENAKTFMDFSRIGDVVHVVGGPRAPELGDHGVMDWDTPWKDWTVVAASTPTTSQPSASGSAVARVR